MNNNIIGVDEVGRGSLVGSAIICAFRSTNKILKNIPYKLRDSKKLSKKNRILIYQELKYLKRKNLINYSIIFGKKKVIEKQNIHKTVMFCMSSAVKNVYKNTDQIIVDGMFIPEDLKQLDIKAVVKADDKFLQVSAASIIAKCFRDGLMEKLHKCDNRFFWDKNAGYPTKKHIKSIKDLGISKFHRVTYRPISQFINKL
ncbi:ribonuclease HII [Alphaproteobacteria bacterium]|nr:ribonuclease HII [Alphaproteobacteria bacterium]